MKEDDKGYIQGVATEALDIFATVAGQARQRLEDGFHGIRPDDLTDFNVATDRNALGRIQQLNQEKYRNLVTLRDEPAIARVVVDDFGGNRETYYICRTAPPSGIGTARFASNRAPIAHIAALEVGQTATLPDGRKVEVVERSLLRPRREKDVWDSRDSIVESKGLGPLTIASLRALLEELAVEADGDVLGQLLAEDQQAANIVEGIRRSVITKMELRDRPVLDQYQDEIFRLPLNKRLALLGPPGTGKTTTLIRRLGQKLDLEFLDPGERATVDLVAAEGGLPHTDSWIMFTPTQLLKKYLQEAFNRESIAVPNKRIRTWNDFRHELGREAFGILRTTTGSGSFVLKDTTTYLSTDTQAQAIGWFDDFEQWQRARFLEELSQSAQRLEEDRDTAVSALGEALSAVLRRSQSGSEAATLIALATEADKAAELRSKLKGETDQAIRGALSVQVRKDNGFLDALGDVIERIKDQSASDDDDLDEQDEQDTEDEETTPSATKRQRAVTAYMQAVRAQARATATGRSISKKSRNGVVLEWLGDRALEQASRGEIGISLVRQTHLQRFANPVRDYFHRIPSRYRAFRRARQQEARWYQGQAIPASELDPLELDVMLLSNVRGGGDLLRDPRIAKNLNDRRWAVLEPLARRNQNQVLVDEATDFSPVQLACMAGLCHRYTRSFFACGDFNQRLTTWGTRSRGDLTWAIGDIDIREINVSYRQSRQLNELAGAIIRAAGGVGDVGVLPEKVDSEGVKPALLESAGDFLVVVDWLSARVREIERFVRQLPSIAIFVNQESEVQRTADALDAALGADNIRVSPCPQGQVMGNDSDVRVFAVEHIKGLEFEAVFFVGVDRLADLHPELFGKYLYVGTTRAATYLGVACVGLLPAQIAGLREVFVPSWESGREDA
ncbi:MAG: ATP-binding domain-containing protein [Lamprocystis purpurea]|jgi:hypothetical protein|uniref:ATP-binding domain-containing protein n=1 Tax=Lamprocystis purpurea TaxID=61598 RepID=UPI0003627312|nr:ATP-binding domain-containing protein [Lamprocystis purpurea]MBV5275892.1 ATP-binding domain-containing protein [Lamprocystis purpurea]